MRVVQRQQAIIVKYFVTPEKAISIHEVRKMFNHHFVGSSGSLYRRERPARGPLFDFVSS